MVDFGEIISMYWKLKNLVKMKGKLCFYMASSKGILEAKYASKKETSLISKQNDVKRNRGLSGRRQQTCVLNDF